LANAKRLPPVDLIREPSWGDVLSDFWAGPATPAGDLDKPLVEAGLADRVGVAALTNSVSTGVPSDSLLATPAAPLFTGRAAELLTAKRRLAPSGRSACLWL